METIPSGAGGANTVGRQLVEPPRETTKREERARSRRGDGGGERRQSLEGGAWRLLAGGGVGGESLLSPYRLCPRSWTE